MATGPHIHWHEGLFLQPHHMQALQARLSAQIVDERRLDWAYSYGLIEARLSPDALENMSVRFDRLRAIMPSGVEVCVPESADLPPLDIKRAYAAGSGSLVVGLAVPLYQPARGNVIDRGTSEDGRVKRMFRVAEVKAFDENTGDNPQAMLVRKVNARLVLEGDDTSEMEVMPILRIARSADEAAGAPKPDGSYVPPCLLLGASPSLRALARDLGNHLEAVRKETALKLGTGGYSIENLRGPQIEQLLRLRTLNVYAGSVPALAALPSLTPFEYYLELRRALGELASLYPDRDPWEAPRYDHDNPAASITELDRKIRQLSRGAVQKKFLSVRFERDGTVMAATLADEHLTQPTDYFLAIQTKMDPAALGRLVEDADKFKFMPKSMWRMNLFGVKLVEERHPPFELPSKVGLHYFRLARGESERMWERIKSEKAAAVRWPDLEPLDFSEMSLYMTLP
ncbi:MAG: type VI secretion system baseplate subunit TssK [Planctomycetota bacterium]|nr:type VI secretion system baseplate subunit TssK [Planctomycetota bacterium]